MVNSTAVIQRSTILSRLRAALERARIILLCGPRQCGKTTLARELVSEESVN